LNAINLLNAEDGGKRRCIIITNNECSESEEKELIAKGYMPEMSNGKVGVLLVLLLGSY
jgi:adenine-specific DNA-methyltransferase